MRAALVLLIVGSGLVLALRSRFAALILYLWFALFRAQEWVWGALDSWRLSMVTGLALLVPALLTGVWPDVRHPLSRGSLALLGLALIAQLWAIDTTAGWAALDPFAVSVVVSLLMVRLVDSRERVLAVALVMAGSLGFYGAKYGLGFLIRGGVPNLDGIGGAFPGNNEVGVAFARMLPLMVVVSQNTSVGAVRLVSRLTVALTVIGVVSTYSRGSVLAMVAAFLVWASLQHRRVAMLSGLATLAVVVVLAVPLSGRFLARMQTIRTYAEIGENSALSRLHFWKVALVMAADQPFGVGLKNFQANFDRYDSLGGRFGHNRDVHSTHFQALVEIGFLGFCIYVGLICLAVARLLRIRSRARGPAIRAQDKFFLFTTSNALLASIAAFVVGGTFNSLLVSELNWYTFALVASLDGLSGKMASASNLRIKHHGTAA